MRVSLGHQITCLGRIVIPAAIVVAGYIALYFILVERLSFTPSVGPSVEVLLPGYRYLDPFYYRLFRPVYWVDKHMLRPHFWESAYSKQKRSNAGR